MKWITMLLLLVFVVGCSSPPEDVKSATVGDTVEESETSEEADAEELDEIVEETESGDDVTEEMDVEEVDSEEATEEVEESTDELAEASETTTVAIDPDKSSFTFTGYGVGKSHSGTFTDMSGELMYEGDMIVGAKGEIQAASVKSDSTGLDNHLKNEDFFNVEVYPTMSFESTAIEDGMLIGELTFLGVTKEISYEVDVTADSVSADFLLDTEQFGMSYSGVESEVRIEFTVSR